MIRRVLDRDGAVLEEWEKTTYKVVNEYVALTMVSMMRGVVEFGTATAARSLGVPLAGKTGTVNDHTTSGFSVIRQLMSPAYGWAIRAGKGPSEMK